MTKLEQEISEGFANLTEINRAYFLAVLRSLNFAQEYGEKPEIEANKKPTQEEID